MSVGNFIKFHKVPIGLTTFIVAFVAISLIIINYNKPPEGSVRKIKRSWEDHSKIDLLKIGTKMPAGPGDTTFAPYLKIPASQKFYVSVAEPDIWCTNEYCSIEGALIQTMGGWLQGEDTDQATSEEFFGLNLPENQHIKSLVVVGDKEGRIVGLYPNKGLKDVLIILKNYRDLADFNLLSGVREFKKLKVGDLSPLKPGDPISHMSDELAKFSLAHIPKDKKFYLYALQNGKYDMAGMYGKHKNQYACIEEAGCRYPEPDPPHDFLYETVDRLGGWFLANDQNNSVMIELFGLNPQEVISGESSLVVLTDSKGIIAALHPQKTMSDALTILSQHPDLADIQKLYQK